LRVPWFPTSLNAWALLLVAPLAIASAQPGGDEVRVSATPSEDRVAPGGQLVIAVVLDHDDHFHTWPSADQDVLPPEVAEVTQFRTAIDVQEQPDAVSLVGHIQWPEPTPASVPDLTGLGGSIEVPVYQGRAIAYVPILIAEDATPGKHEMALEVTYQACDDTICLMPQFPVLSVPFEVVADIEALAPNQPSDGSADKDELFAAFDASVFATLARAATDPDEPPSEPSQDEPQEASTDGEAPATSQGPGLPSPDTGAGQGFRPKFLGLFTVPDPSSSAGLAVVALFGVIGGLVLNLTPCVLPVIPIKVMTISQHAGTRGRTLLLGSSMALGVVAFWIAAGLPVILLTTFSDPSQIFGIWWVTAGIGAVIAGMALGLMGMFQINLPQGVYKLNPKANTLPGSFIFGIMTAVLGLPCFGFVAGALLPAAAAAPDSVVMAIFASLGVGMALPYLVLSLWPGLVERLPRTGPASELVKQVMGLLLLAAAAYFIGSGLIGLVSDKPWMGRQLHWWAVALFAAVSAIWLILRTFQITPSAGKRAVVALLAVVIGGAAIVYAWDSTRSARLSYEARQAAAPAEHASGLVTTTWIDYSPTMFDLARDDGKVVVLDFTAEWCLNCKALKATVLNREPVKQALAQDDVISMTVDLTSQSAPGWNFLRELGQTGIPLLAIYRPGDPEPWQANVYTPDQVIAALDWAREGRELALGTQ